MDAQLNGQLITATYVPRYDDGRYELKYDANTSRLVVLHVSIVWFPEPTLTARLLQSLIIHDVVEYDSLVNG
jgi:hypothetical protein